MTDLVEMRIGDTVRQTVKGVTHEYVVVGRNGPRSGLFRLRGRCAEAGCGVYFECVGYAGKYNNRHCVLHHRPRFRVLKAAE
jgi:hypothetical protein